MTTDIAVAPEIRSLVLSGTDLVSYQSTVLREAQQRLAVREQGVAAAEAELAEADKGVAMAEWADVPTQVALWEARRSRAYFRIRRRTKQVDSAKKFLSLVEDGYLPIPRLPGANDVRYLRDPLPPEVLEVLGQEQLHGRFVEFQVVGVPDQWATRRNRRLLAGLDPILVGLCDREMFPLAWWR